MKNNRTHAVVIGGSMAGLLAARVLSNHFARVTIIERDTLPESNENRRGVPQGRHTHGLLASGGRVLERLFPGISAELVSGGAEQGDVLGDCRWFFEGGCHFQQRGGLAGLLMSRPFVEGHVRKRVRQISNIEFREGAALKELLFSPDRKRVLGVQCDGSEQPVFADLVVDASGRGSHALQWLEEAGYAKPAEERVEVSLSYTTRFFERRPEQLNGDTATIIAPTPEGKVGGVMLAQEGSRWTVTLISQFGPAAPSDLDGFIEFTRKLPAPYIYEVVRETKPMGDAFVSKYPASVRRRFEKLRRFPEGYLVMGDAICSFNPIYGQGMSVAALEAVELDSLLSSAGMDTDLARRFFARAAKLVDVPWSIAVGNDLRVPEVPGPRPLMTRLINAYMKKLHKAAHFDPSVALAFHRVSNLLDPPSAILAPGMLARVLLRKPDVKMRGESVAAYSGGR